MKEIEINTILDFVNMLITNGVMDDEPDGHKTTRDKVVKTITTTTYTLIEDEQLVKYLVKFCTNRFVLDGQHIDEIKVRKLLGHRYNIVNLFKLADRDDDYIYVMDYPDIYNYRYEGDYCPDAEPTIHRYSFSEVLDEFIDSYPDRCHWTETVETKVVED